MTFEDFIHQGKVRRALIDSSKMNSLLETSRNHLLFIQDQRVTPISASSILVLSYESLREVVEAACIKKGFLVYSHEAFTHFLKEQGEEHAAQRFDALRKMRNAINYYGEKVEVEEAIKAREDAVKLIKKIKETLLKERF